MRELRRNLDDRDKQLESARIIRRIKTMGVYLKAERIAVYLAFDGEPDLGKLIDDAWSRGKQVAVPTISGNSMRFTEFRPNSRVSVNHFGISEPVADRAIETRSLDLVLTPVLAIDDFGTRLGVGGGYYDRHFAFLLRRRQWLHPKLLGVAYDFQQVEQLPSADWDVPLWGAVTPSGSRIFE